MAELLTRSAPAPRSPQPRPQTQRHREPAGSLTWGKKPFFGTRQPRDSAEYSPFSMDEGHREWRFPEEQPGGGIGLPEAARAPLSAAARAGRGGAGAGAGPDSNRAAGKRRPWRHSSSWAGSTRASPCAAAPSSSPSSSVRGPRGGLGDRAGREGGWERRRGGGGPRLVGRHGRRLGRVGGVVHIPFPLRLNRAAYGINSILYQRGIYPPETFTRVQKYGLTLLVTTDPELANYLNNVTEQMKGAGRRRGPPGGVPAVSPPQLLAL